MSSVNTGNVLLDHQQLLIVGNQRLDSILVVRRPYGFTWGVSAKKGLVVWRGVAQRALRNIGLRANEVPGGKKVLPISYEFSPPPTKARDLRARDLGMCIPR